jgi:hypothetical protein
VTVSAVSGFAREARGALRTLQDELTLGRAGFVSVSGVLAEQLGRELGAGSEPGAVQVGGESLPPGAEVHVRVVAGDLTDVDVALVRAADARGAPIVLVQLWPQADWTRPYVLSPFVVECRAGEGFPVREIADRLVDACSQGSLLAFRIPLLRESVERKVVQRSVVRSALLAAFARKPATRPLLTLEQLRMVARLGVLSDGGCAGARDERAALGGVLGAVVASGFAFRGVARTARFVVPAPVANVAVAAAGTWALARAAKAFAARSAS